MRVTTSQIVRIRAWRPFRSAAVGVAIMGLVTGAWSCGRSHPDDASKASDTGDGADSASDKDTTDDGTMLVSQPETPPAPRPTEPLPPDASCITAECHTRHETAPYIHGPVGAVECSACHEPDQGDHTYPLVRQGNDLCVFCHSIGGQHAYQHAALEDPGCVSCHDPHVSDAKFLLTEPDIESLCLGCHVIDEGVHRHGPMRNGQCTACHQPHESDYSQLLRGGEGPAFCFGCHDEAEYAMATARVLHDPAVEDCTTCHNPHRSDYEHALDEPIDAGCVSCHEDIEYVLLTADVPHAAVSDGRRCANCHDPHASDRAMLLRDRQDVLCLSCHDRPVTTGTGRVVQDMTPELRDREFAHGPVAMGECDSCHEPHGSRNENLLRARFSSRFYDPFDIDNYALCFQCHDPAIVLDEETTAVTSFRDGPKNLHFLHVNDKDKGRTCKACHDTHASNHHAHVAESVPFDGSDWAMPIGFEPTATGGRCSPGCHEPMSYDRFATPTERPDDVTGGTP
jgi:predicted CXXCH cytochrome family protein